MKVFTIWLFYGLSYKNHTDEFFVIIKIESFCGLISYENFHTKKGGETKDG